MGCPGICVRGRLAIIAKTRNVVHYVWRHPANEGRRGRALARAAGYQARARLLGRRVQVRLGERSRLWVEPHRAAAVKAVYGNPPDFAEMMVWRQVLRPGDLFLDVGANVGGYSVWAGELGAEVIALEPAEDTFRLLADNVALNGFPIRAVQAAAGAACGTARFTSGHDALNRLDPGGAAEVAVVTIDSLLGGGVAAGMKIDVEGFEIDVLRGCERALREQRIGLIQLEWNHECLRSVGTDRKPVAELLASCGYRLYRPAGDGRLEPLADLGFGPDVFARPTSTETVDYF
jgi:FkbM family methyltransferase